MKHIIYFSIILLALSLTTISCAKKNQNIAETQSVQNENTNIPVNDSASDNDQNAEQKSEFTDRKPFIFTISTDMDEGDDEEAGDNIKIPVFVYYVNKEYPVKFDLDCDSDGVYEFIGLSEIYDSDEDVYNPRLHFCNYKKNSGIHKISVRGNIPAMQLCSIRCKYCEPDTITSFLVPVISIDSWGDIQWKSMHNFASHCPLVAIPSEAPNLSDVKDMSGTFSFSKFNLPLDNWDVSNVTNMSGMFANAISFNQPLDNWDVSRVEKMSEMFAHAKSFNQPLNQWKVSNVTDMSSMFEEADSFNQPLDNWDVSGVEDMSGMFYNATSFNQPLEKWNVSNVKNMGGMFFEATSFNQPLDKWNISNVTNMNGMFGNASSYSHYPKTWIVPKGQSEDMFKGTKVEKIAKDKPLKIENR